MWNQQPLFGRKNHRIFAFSIRLRMWWASISMAVVFSPPLGNDDVGVALAGLHKGLVHGLDRGQVLLDHAVQAAAALLHVPHKTAQDALVGVGVHEDLVVEHGAQLRLYKGQDALHDEHRGRFDVLHFVTAVVVGVVVYGAVDGTAGLELLQVVDEQGIVESVRVVVVQLAALFKGQVVVALIVAVVGDQPHLVLAKALLQPQGQGGLAAAGTACNANDQIVHSRNSSCTKTLSAPVEKPTEMDYNRRNQRSAGAACGPAAFCSIYHTIKCPVLTARKGGRVQFFQLAGGLPRRKQTRCKHNSCSRT